MPTAQDAYVAAITLREDALRGRQKAQAADTFMWTYAAAYTAQVPVTGVNLQIAGCRSANKIIKVRRIGVTGTAATTAGGSDMTVAKRSTKSTGGVGIVLASVPFDPQDPPGTAVITQYTTAPTAGALVGQVRSYKVVIATAGALLPLVPTAQGLDFLAALSQPLTLRTPDECLTLDFTAFGGVGPFSLDVFVEWTEELIPGEPYPKT